MRPAIGDRVLTQYGFGIVTHQSHKRGLVRVEMEENPIVKHDCRPEELIPEQFIDYITRPSGFGLVPWPVFISVNAILMVIASMCAAAGAWIGVASCGAVLISEFLVTLVDFKRKATWKV